MRTIHMASAPGKSLFVLLFSLGFILNLVAGDKIVVFDQKLAAPQKTANAAATAFKKRFLTDTGATNALRAEFVKTVKLGPQPAQDHFKFKFDLSKWPKEMQSSGRLWVAVGAAADVSASGVLSVTFSQNGVGVSTDLNNTYTVDHVMILGADNAVTNGEVTLNVKNQTCLPKVKLSICAIAYMPEKTATAQSAK